MLIKPSPASYWICMYIHLTSSIWHFLRAHVPHESMIEKFQQLIGLVACSFRVQIFRIDRRGLETYILRKDGDLSNRYRTVSECMRWQVH